MIKFPCEYADKQKKQEQHQLNVDECKVPKFFFSYFCSAGGRVCLTESGRVERERDGKAIFLLMVLESINLQDSAQWLDSGLSHTHILQAINCSSCKSPATLRLFVLFKVLCCFCAA